MNWTAILAANGIPEPPGRQQAVEEAQALSAAKKQAKQEKKKK